MKPAPLSIARVALIGACATLAACSTVGNATRDFAGRLSPYRVEVVQGNFVSREQAELLRPGMTRLQVRDLLGSPLVTSVFHADRWDYVFTLQRHGEPRESRRLSVFFKGDALERHEADPLPSESEFVARLGPRNPARKIPPLEASEESLKAFAERNRGSDAGAAATQAQAAQSAPARSNYPPLEPAR